MQNCTLIFTYSSKNSAIAILNSTKPDNYEFVKAKVKGNQLISEIKAKNISSLIHTIEDYLSCVSMAEKLLKN